MKGIKTYITTPWRIWGDPLLERNYSGLYPSISPSAEKNPNGHNTLLLKSRDHIFTKWPIPVYASHTYQFTVTAKRVADNLPLGVGFWGYGEYLFNLTQIFQRPELIKDLGDGWGIYRKTANPRGDCNKAYLYFQLEQHDPYPCRWLVSDIKVVDLTETGGAISKFLSALPRGRYSAERRVAA